MNQRTVSFRNNKAVTWLVLWAGTALLSAVLLSFLGLTAERASAADRTSYTVTDLGTLGGDFSMAEGINNSGQIAGSSNTASGAQHAFLYENGSMQDLGTLGGMDYDSASDINDSGQIVGTFNTGVGCGGRQAFLYENGSMQDLGTLGGDISSASGINDKGQIVGYSTKAGGGPYDLRAILYQNGAMQDLGTFSSTPGTRSVAFGINNNGQIVGYSLTASGAQQAFLYQNGAMQNLGTLGGRDSFANNINDNGQIAGYSLTASGAQHAFLYENGSMQDLGTLGGRDSEADGINGGGQIVGRSSTASGESHAFLYEDGSMHDLNSLIPQDSNWTLSWAYDINENGQIVGSGVVNVDGVERQHAFLLTPVPQTSVDSVSQSAVAGDTVSTATGDGSASPSDPVNTSITTPVAGTVSIQETSVSQPETAGFSFFGQQVNIEAPQASAQDPLALRFVVDSSLMPSGTDHNTMQLFRDGVRIEPCVSGASATAASPDPCIKQRSQLPDGDAAITILSSHASAWNLGVATTAPLYSFKGFFQPVDKLPTVNTVKAGAAVPVRFSLGGDKGLDIFISRSYPLSGQVPSTPNAPLDQIEQTVTASASGLSYSAGTGQYTYTWKTDKGWAGQARQLVLRLKDGTEHKASFKLTK